MKLSYMKVSKNILKFFYQKDGEYAEFYINLKPEKEGKYVHSYGEAEFLKKHPDYDEALANLFANFFVEHYNEKLGEEYLKNNREEK